MRALLWRLSLQLHHLKDCRKILVAAIDAVEVDAKSAFPRLQVGGTDTLDFGEKSVAVLFADRDFLLVFRDALLVTEWAEKCLALPIFFWDVHKEEKLSVQLCNP